MKREIKFKGLRVDNNEFVYGSFIHNSIDCECIIDIEAEQFEVIPESVGQFTGLKDKNGVDIYDSDICKVESKHGFNSDLLTEFKELNNLDTINGISGHFTGIVRIDFFRGLMFENPLNGYCEPIFNRKIDISINHSGIEVIGNIYENKHQL